MSAEQQKAILESHMSKDRAESYPFFDIARPIAIAHRGGNLTKEQNTPEAFESARKAGLTHVETDTVRTADDTSVIFHGSEDLPKELRNGYPTSEQIESLTYYEAIKKLGRALLRTEELLADYPKLRVFIDPKTGGAVVPLAKAIKNQKAEDRVNVGSFRYQRTQYIAELLGHQISTSFFKYRKIQAHQPGITLRQAMDKNGFNTLQIPVDLISDADIARYKEMGIWVIAWAKMGPKDDPRKYDTPEFIEQTVSKGFDGLISDHTQELVDVFLSRDPENPSIRK